MDAAQLPLALRYPADQRLDTFVAAPEGALAQLQALAAGQGDWLLLSGPPGSGRTHLLIALCAQADAQGRSTAYVPLRAAAGRVRDALQGLDGLDVVALDDLDAVAGHRDDEVALFDFYNRARGTGTAVAFAAAARPDAMGLALPDLRSRLGQCSALVLDALDDAGRRDVLRQRAQRRGLQLEDAALDWMLRRLGRDLAGLTQVFERLDRAALAAQRRLTVPFLRETLGPSVRG